MKTTKRSISGTGLFALDIIVRLNGSKSSPSLGGSAGNVLSILGALGWSAAPVGVLGDDSAGQTIRQEFEQVGADLRLLRCSEARRTPVIYQHQIDRASADCDSTHRFTFACPHCGARSKPQWEDDPHVSEFHSELPWATVFYFDRPTRLGIELAEQYALDGAIVVFEPSAVGESAEMFAKAMRVSHIVKYADERLCNLNAFDLRPDAIEIQTLGPKGLRFRSAAFDYEWTHLSAFKPTFLHDTAGAGDWCTAGMLYHLFEMQNTSSWVDKEAVARALSFGQVLSMLNCMTEGARGLLATWSIEQILRIARAMDDTRTCSSEVAKKALQSFAHEVEHTMSASGLSGDRFICCSGF